MCLDDCPESYPFVKDLVQGELKNLDVVLFLHYPNRSPGCLVAKQPHSMMAPEIKLPKHIKTVLDLYHVKHLWTILQMKRRKAICLNQLESNVSSKRKDIIYCTRYVQQDNELSRIIWINQMVHHA